MRAFLRHLLGIDQDMIAIWRELAELRRELASKANSRRKGGSDE